MYASPVLLLLSAVMETAGYPAHALYEQVHETQQQNKVLIMKSNKPEFSYFKKIYEPSGVVQLSDEQLLVVDDEEKKPLILLSFNQTSPHEKLHKKKAFKFSSIKKLSDLEGLTRDKHNHVYTITSHSRTLKDKVKKSRNRFIRFKIEDSVITGEIVLNDLRDWMIDNYPILKKADENRKNQAENLVNIEGLAYNPTLNQIYLGLRSPLNEEKKAIIIPLDKPEQIFETRQLPETPDELITLDLNGAGIRAMCYDEAKEGYFIISGSVAEDKIDSKLWFWEAWRNEPPIQVAISGVKNLRNAEGITPVRLHNGEKGLFIVSDDGSKSKQRGAGYLFIPYTDLKIN